MNLPAFSAYRPAVVLSARPAATDQVRVFVQPREGFVASHQYAGQFCRMRVAGTEGIFAMASAPGLAPVEFLVRVGAGDGGDAADRLATLPDGGPVEMSLAAGEGFGLPADAATIVCVATGTGVAPVCAAIDAWLATATPNPARMTLIHGVQSAEHVAIQPRLDAWRARGVDTRLCFSRLDDKGVLVGESVQDTLAREHPDLRDATVLAVGQPAMVEDLRQRAVGLGLPAARFLTNL